MPVRAYLKRLWETKIACCGGVQTADTGDKSTRAPVALSRLSPSATRRSKTSEVVATYPFVPIFFIILFLIHLCAPQVSVHAIKAAGITSTDHIPEHDTPQIKMVSAANTQTLGDEQEARNNGAQANPGARIVSALNRASDDKDQDAGNAGAPATSTVKVMTASKHQPRDDDDDDDDDDEDVTRDNGTWVVAGVGSFSKRAVYTFEQDYLPAGLTRSDYTVHCREVEHRNQIPFNERFDPANVQLSNGFLTLTVPGGQRPVEKDNYAISCAEVTTVEENILYASVRTIAIFSEEPGTCHGMFFYQSDTQEIDIEYLTDPESLSNFGPDMPIPMWYTNQPVDPTNGEKTSQSGTSPTNGTSDVHEYRIDWTEDCTAFYIDGVLQRNYTVNVPNKPGPWVWNNWANGDKGWSAGPPQGENAFQIQKITMYYNTAEAESSASSSRQEVHDTENVDE